MHIKYLTHESIAYLRSERVSFYHLPGDTEIDSSVPYDRAPNGWQMSDHMYGKIGIVPGDCICFFDDAQVSKVTGFHVKRFSDTKYIDMHSMGYMSFTASNLGPETVVGRYCSISWNIKIIQFDHPTYTLSTNPFVYSNQYDFDLNHLSVQLSGKHRIDAARQLCDNPQKDKIIIGHDVWMGSDVAIRKGVSIGTGSVIAANSVVTKDVEPYSIMGGNPAKLIRKRFPDTLVQELLASEWWEYNYLDFCDLPLGDPAKFVKLFESRKASIEKYNPGYIDLRAIP